MPSDTAEFDRRLRRINQVYNQEVNRAQRREGLGYALGTWFRQCMMLLLIFVLLTFAKLALDRGVGPASYDAHVARLQGGDVTEQAVGWVLRRGPVMDYASGLIEKAAAL